MRNSVGKDHEQLLMQDERKRAERRVRKLAKVTVPSYGNLDQIRKFKEKVKRKRTKKSRSRNHRLTKKRSKTMTAFKKFREIGMREDKENERFSLNVVENNLRKIEEKHTRLMKKMRRSYRDRLESLVSLDTSLVRAKKTLKNQSTEETLKQPSRVLVIREKERVSENRTNSRRKNVVLTSLKEILSRESSQKMSSSRERNITQCKPDVNINSPRNQICSFGATTQILL